MKRLKNRIKTVLFSLRDSLSFYLAGFPIKMGEIGMLIEMIECSNKKFSKPKNKYANIILLVLIINFILTSMISLINWNTINTGFFTKYIIKNIVYILFVFLIAFSSKKISEDFFCCLFKGIVLVQLIIFILLYIFNLRIEYIYVSSPKQIISFGNITIPRFAGTASEPAYIVPILALPLFYFTFNFKNNKLFLILTLIFMIFTFSPFAAMIVFIDIVFFIIKKYRKNSLKLFGIVLLTILVLLLVYFIISLTPFGEYVNRMIDKAIGYISGGNQGDMDWSAMDRNQHLNFAKKLISQSSFLELIFGRGTGAYYYQSLKSSSVLVNNVEEAYNLYLSTIVDRGLIGLINLLIIPFCCIKMTSKNLISNTLLFGIIVQFIHYFLVGNLWLYFLWMEIGMLISYECYLRSSENENISYSQ